MPFKNRIRLPFYLRQPQFPTETTTFRKASGVTKILNVTMRNTFQGVTDWMTKELHQRLAVALAHDNVTIEGSALFSGVTKDGDYSIEWLDFLDYQKGQGTFSVNVTPFDVTNNNCVTCDEATQLSLIDDTIPGSLDDGQEGIVNVSTNDTICCFPALFEIMTFNTTWLVSAEIDQNGVLTVVAKDPVGAAGNINVVTYRVTCPGGGYDEADVRANFSGSGSTCVPPENVQVTAIGEDTATLTFDDPGGVFLYRYWLYTCEDLGTPVHIGFLTDADPIVWNDLDAAQCYTLVMRRICGFDSSETVTVEFNTTSPEENCGQFLVSCDDGTTEREQYNYTFMNCSGELVNAKIINLGGNNRCMLTDAGNNPVYFAGDAPVTYEYIGPC